MFFGLTKLVSCSANTCPVPPVMVCPSMRQAGSWVNEFVVAGSWVNEFVVAELALLQPFQANEFTGGFQV